jgi:hypothetical protein
MRFAATAVAYSERQVQPAGPETRTTVRSAEFELVATDVTPGTYSPVLGRFSIALHPDDPAPTIGVTHIFSTENR